MRIIILYLLMIFPMTVIWGEQSNMWRRNSISQRIGLPMSKINKDYTLLIISSTQYTIIVVVTRSKC